MKKFIIISIILGSMGLAVYFKGDSIKNYLSPKDSYTAQAETATSTKPTRLQTVKMQIDEMTEARKKDQSYISAKAEGKRELEATIEDMKRRFESDWEMKARQDAITVYEVQLDAERHEYIKQLETEKKALEAKMKR